MSYHEAKEDSITYKQMEKGGTAYYPPCRFCGAPVLSWSYLRNIKYACPACRQEAVSQVRAEEKEKEIPVKEQKLVNAIKRISKVSNVSLYEDAIVYVRNHINKAGWFQSTEEIMVALELIKCGITAHHQVKVFEYTVDFVLPDLHVVLEIDGMPYHGKDRQKYQQIRDEAIAWKLGQGWEVIRINTDNINTNVTKLLPGIMAVLTRRRKH